MSSKLPTFKHAVLDLHISRVVKSSVCIDNSLFQCSGRRDHLKSRSRFVGVCEREISSLLSRVVSKGIWVKCWAYGNCQYLSGIRLHRQCQTSARPCLFNSLRYLSFAYVLYDFVYCQDDCISVYRGYIRVLTFRNLLPGSVSFSNYLTVRSLESAVVVHLQAFKALIINSSKSQHMCCKGSFGIEPLGALCYRYSWKGELSYLI